jgi:hypothetical protein
MDNLTTRHCSIGFNEFIETVGLQQVEKHQESLELGSKNARRRSDKVMLEEGAVASGHLDLKKRIVILSLGKDQDTKQYSR